MILGKARFPQLRPRRRQRFLLRCCFLISLGLIPAAGRPVLVQNVEGTAWYTLGGQTRLLTLAVPYLDPVVDFLTEGNSSIFVSPFPGTTVRLDQMSQMRVESIESSPLPGGGTHHEARINLLSGKMTAFTGIKNQATNLTVTTPDLKLEFRQALCVVCCSENDTHVYVAKGDVWMTQMKQGVALPRRLLRENGGMLNLTSDGNTEIVPMEQADPGAKGCLAAGLTRDILGQGLEYAAGTSPPSPPIGLGGPPIILDGGNTVSPTR